MQSSCVSTATGDVICPTSFANPVNFGMTFNKSLFFDLGHVIGVETRALWLAGCVPCLVLVLVLVFGACGTPPPRPLPLPRILGPTRTPNRTLVHPCAVVSSVCDCICICTCV